MISQHREVPDLVGQIADLQKRISTLESANRLGSASIDGGELTVRNGDIVVRNVNDEEVTRLTHGSSPRIKFTPTFGPDQHFAEILAWESQYQGAAIQMGVMDPSGAQDGGKLLLLKGVTYLSHQPDDAEETYIALSRHAAYDNHISTKGYWQPERVEGDEAWEMGFDTIDAGFSGYSHGFSFPYDTPPLLMYGMTGAAATFYHCISNVDVNGFTILWSDALAHTVSWMAIRR